MPGIRAHAAHRQIGAQLQLAHELALVRTIAAERRLDRELHRARAAQPAVGQLLDRRQHLVQPIRSADREPARPPAWREIRLRQRRERDDRRVGREAAQERRRAVEAEVAVDLVGQNRHARAIGELDERASRRFRIHGAGRIVRVDEHDRACCRRDQSPHVVEVRHPVPRRVGAVVDGARAELAEHRGVERIGGRRHEHLVAGVRERAQRELDAFRRARSEHDAIR